MKLTTFNIIVAVDKNFGIAKDNKIPWRNSDDLAFFKRQTDMSIVIMGRKTFESIPTNNNSYKLPNRIIFVISSTLEESKDKSYHIFKNIKEALNATYSVFHRDVYIIGGQEIYREAIEKYGYLCKKIYMTTIKNTFDCDRFFPYDALYRDALALKENIDFNECLISVYDYNVDHEETQYLVLLKTILSKGDSKDDRTGVGTLSITGAHMKFDISNSIPILTTKKILWKKVLIELLWFLSGSTDVSILQQKGVSFWNANTTREFLDKRGLTHLPEGDIGQGYGHLWRHWGAEYKTCKDDYTGKGIDQIIKIINLLKNEPFSRRIILTAWNPETENNATLPPCFTKGTLVLTNSGYKNIEDVVDSDKLYTHTGKFQKINQIYITNYSGCLYDLKIAYHPHIISTTPEHPFYAKKVIKNGKNRTFGEPEWISAKDLDKTYFVGMKINTKNNIPIFRVEKGSNMNKKIIIERKLDNPDHWFMMGFFIGDGWLRKNNQTGRNNISFCMNSSDIKYVYPRIRKILNIYEVKPSKNTTNCRKFEGSSKLWYKILSYFGFGALNKKIPQWVHNAPKRFIKEFLLGYNMADGCYYTIENKNNISITTVSKNLALSVQRLYLKIGKIVSLYVRKARENVKIQGRNVKENDLYSIKKSGDGPINGALLGFIKDDYAWYYIRNKTERIVKNENVYNFAVDEDNSYTIENLMVHNCHSFIQFLVVEKENTRYLDCILTQRSGDMFLGVPFNIASYSMLTYILADLCDMKPRYFIHNIGDAHIYKNHISSVKEQLSNTPLSFPKFIIKNKKENIDDFCEDDFDVLNYESANFIKAEMAV